MQQRLPLSPKPDPSRGAAAILEGVLDKVTFASEETAWSVVRVAVTGRREPVTAVGNLLGVQPGESLRLTGQWVTDKKYGEQFRVESYVTLAPATLVGIQRYLGSGLVRGMGKVMASRLVDHFGLRTLEVIDTEPERLLEVEGIGPVRSEEIRKAWIEQREIKQVMIFLQSHGVSTLHATKIYKRYKDRAVALVRENPYRLAADIFGIGFKTADAIAHNLGIAKTSPERAKAGLLFALSTLQDEGHTGYPRGPLVERAAALLEIDAVIVEDAVRALHEAGEIVLEKEAGDDHEAVFAKAMHDLEAGVAELLARSLARPVSPLRIDIPRALAWFEEQHHIELAAEQREAISRAITEKILVVTGGPGTGKTTLIKGVIQILEKKGRYIVLTAPTGRAAKRMAETTGREAKTVHRLLEYSPRTLAFERNAAHPIDAELLILDEMSMVDTSLVFHLLSALSADCQLVLVGDVDQLPSVGPGNVLMDLIRSGSVPVVRLSHIFRQAEKSLIVVNAHRVNEGKLPTAKTDGGEGDFFFVEKEDPAEILETIKTLIQERIPRKFGVDAVEDIQVLSPMQKGMLGAAQLNVELQRALNPSGPSVTRGQRTFRTNDKVMQLRNNYDLDVFNGDIGRIRSIDESERIVVVDFDGRSVTYDEGDLDELVCAYACSIHKSQGSEYPCVIIPLHTQHYVMLRKNLLYTAITRGKRLVVIVGSKRALSSAVRNGEADARFTRLANRLRTARVSRT
jgi:exodeoxyribonuclease V alpha subunit